MNFQDNEHQLNNNLGVDYTNHQQDVESQNEFQFKESDLQIRLGFVRKVYCILST
jgi:hypothetical protein